MPDTTLAALLRRLRTDASLSQEELAERAGMSVQAVSSLERGARRHPYPRTLRALMDALEASEDDRLALLEAAAAPADPLGASARTEAVPVRAAQLPAPAGDFTGRLDEIGWIRAVLSRDGPMPICAISGKPGIGKSTLAIQIAHLLKPRFPDAQLYATLHGMDPAPRSPSSVLTGFLRALGVRGDALPQQPDDQAALYRSLLEDRAALVVLDDAHDESQVRMLMPGSPSCAVLVTSRQPLTALPGAELRELRDMSAADATELLTRIAGSARVRQQADAAADVVHLCGLLPLAVRIAGAVLQSRPRLPLASLVQRLADERRRLDELHAGDLDVRTSFSLSYRWLRDEDARVFRFLGQLPVSTFSVDVVAAMLPADRVTTEDALDRLYHAQLIQHADYGHYSLHDLIRLFAQERLAAEDPSKESAEALLRAYRWYLTTTRQAADDLRRPGGERSPVHAHECITDASRAALDHFEAEWSNVAQAVTRAAGSRHWELAQELAEALQPFFAVQARWTDQERTQQLGYQAARELGDRRSESRFLCLLATLYQDQGRTEEAADYFNRSLAICTALDDRQGMARALYGLGSVHRRRGELDQARSCHDQSIGIFHEIGDREGEGRSLNALGLVLSNMGDQLEAYSCWEQSLELLREAGDRHGEGYVLVNLGDHMRYLGRLEDAVDFYEQHLAICRELRDADCAMWTLVGLVGVRIREGELSKALALSDHLVAASMRSADRAFRARALDIAGDVHRARGDPEAAAVLYQRSLTIHLQRGDRQNQCWTLNRLGDAWSDLGRWADAAGTFEQSLAIALELRIPPEQQAILRRLNDVYRRWDRQPTDSLTSSTE